MWHVLVTPSSCSETLSKASTVHKLALTSLSLQNIIHRLLILQLHLTICIGLGTSLYCHEPSFALLSALWDHPFCLISSLPTISTVEIRIFCREPQGRRPVHCNSFLSGLDYFTLCFVYVVLFAIWHFVCISASWGFSIFNNLHF